MSGKKKKKAKRRSNDPPTLEKWEQMLERVGPTVLVIEAAGDVNRAIRVGDLEDPYAPFNAEGMRETAPPSRGGQNEGEEAEELWNLMVKDLLEDPENWQYLRDLQQTFDEREQSLNRQQGQGR